MVFLGQIDMYDKWSLKVLYSGFDDEKFQKDFQKIDELIAQYQTFAEKLGSEDIKTTLKNALLLTEEFNMLLNDLFGYCSLVQSTDTANADSASYMGQLMQKVSDVTKPSTLIDKYIAKIENLDAVIGEDPLLKEYAYYLHEVQKADKHTLHEDVEEAISRMDTSGGTAWSDLQSFLTSSVKVDFRGETTTLSSIRNMAYSADSATRKEAYEAAKEVSEDEMKLMCKKYSRLQDRVSYYCQDISL